jgi:hypothetical protein
MKYIDMPEGGMDLKKALTIYKNVLRESRVLYVIQPNLDLGKITKFGIAGMDSGNPFSRLEEYVLMYGPVDPKNHCQGVKVFFIGVTKYNRLVEAKNSQVFKIEKKLKQELKSQHENIGRGLERTTKKPELVIKRIKELTKQTGLQDEESNLYDPDLVSSRTRKETQRYRDDKKAYINSSKRTSERNNELITKKKTDKQVTQEVRRSARQKANQLGPS